MSNPTTTDNTPPHNLMEKANYMRKNMGSLEKELSEARLREKHQGIQVQITGDGKIESITFDPEIQNNSLHSYSSKITEAVNKAYIACERNRQNQLLSILSQIDEG